MFVEQSLPAKLTILGVCRNIHLPCIGMWRGRVLRRHIRRGNDLRHDVVHQLSMKRLKGPMWGNTKWCKTYLKLEQRNSRETKVFCEALERSLIKIVLLTNTVTTSPGQGNDVVCVPSSLIITILRITERWLENTINVVFASCRSPWALQVSQNRSFSSCLITWAVL